MEDKVVQILLKLSSIPKNEDMILGKAIGLMDYWECSCGRQIHIKKFNFATSVWDSHTDVIWKGDWGTMNNVYNLLIDLYSILHNKNKMGD
jgi:hypothetical protein